MEDALPLEAVKAELLEDCSEEEYKKYIQQIKQEDPLDPEEVHKGGGIFSEAGLQFIEHKFTMLESTILQKFREVELKLERLTEILEGNETPRPVVLPVEKAEENIFFKNAVRNEEDLMKLENICKENMEYALVQMKPFRCAREFLLHIGSYDAYQNISVKMLKEHYSHLLYSLVTAFSDEGSGVSEATSMKDIFDVFYKAKARVNDRLKKKQKRSQMKDRDRRANKDMNPVDLVHEKVQGEDANESDARQDHDLETDQDFYRASHHPGEEENCEETGDENVKHKSVVEPDLEKPESRSGSPVPKTYGDSIRQVSEEEFTFKRNSVKSLDDLHKLDSISKMNMKQAMTQMKPFGSAHKFLLHVGSYDTYQHISAKKFRETYVNLFRALITVFTMDGSGMTKESVIKDISETFYRAKARVNERLKKKRKREEIKYAEGIEKRRMEDRLYDEQGDEHPEEDSVVDAAWMGTL